MSIGIYKFENIINQHKYIGQSSQIDKRCARHISDSNNPNCESYNYPLERAIRKYGIDNFKIDIIEECQVKELDDKEIYWISFYDSYFNGYNQTLGGNGGGHSVKISSDTLLQIIQCLENNKEYQAEIAKKFNVSAEMIQGINTGRYWRMDREYPINKSNPYYNYEKQDYIYKEENHCIVCGKIILKESKKCIQCENNSRKTQHNLLEIAKSIKEKGLTKTGEDYGVSRTSIARWFKKENLPYTKDEIIEWYNEQVGIIEKKKVKLIIQQLDKDTLEVINTFDTPTAAAQALGDVKKSSHISAVCNGNRLTAYGFKWQYKEIN